MLLPGLLKLTRLNRLKNSVRHSSDRRSLTGIPLFTEKSRLRCAGPRRRLRPESPKPLPARTKAAVLKYAFKRSCTRPERSAVARVAPGAKLARLLEVPYSAAPLV